MRRKADRARYDAETVDSILDEALVCHVGFSVEGRPWVIPTAFARIDDLVYMHGATGNHALRTLAAGTEACVTVTLLDGLVLARSAFKHSMNYRSVMLFGHPEEVTGEDEKRAALTAIVDHMVPGRSAETRAPTPEELRSTLVVRMRIDEGSAKVRAGGPLDQPSDLGLPYWAGVIPVSLTRGEPVREGTSP